MSMICFTTMACFLVVEVRPECYVDDDCSYSDVCNKGSCINACRLSDCGINAKCETDRHSARCLCLSGYTGNPRTACSLCKYLTLFTLFSYFLCLTLRCMILF